MNENELTTLLERAGDGLTPDVEGMVAGGAARGRRSLRRRRITSGLGAVAAVAVIVSGISLWPTGEAPTVVDDPGFAAAPPEADRELADPDLIKDRLVDALPDGEVSTVVVNDEDPNQDRWPVRRVTISLRLNDAEVEAEIVNTTPEDPASVPDPGTRPDGCTDAILAQRTFTDAEMGDPEIRACSRWRTEKESYECSQDPECWAERNAPHCERPDAYVTCARLADGSWVSTNDFSSPAEGGHEPGVGPEGFHTWADIETPDDHWITVSSTQPKSPDRDRPLLDFATLMDLVSSDIWFS